MEYLNKLEKEASGDFAVGSELFNELLAEKLNNLNLGLFYPTFVALLNFR
ncbi:hypothetical protein [Natranaerobius trueperi]|nr:hypothetical protein [Natranaerobius trueperi]